jgi:hypothetical protein
MLRPAAMLAVLLTSLLGTSALAAAAQEHARRGPIDATVTADARRAVTATIGPSGGTMVMPSRGAIVRLTVPAGALPRDTVLTMTPVVRFTGRRIGRGLLSGVRLGPEGLRLLRHASLRFDRTGRAPRGRRLAFLGSSANGRDVYRMAPQLRVRGAGPARRIVPTGRPVVPVIHFSTVEAFDWSTLTLQALDDVLVPQAGERRMDQEFARALLDGDDEMRVVEAGAQLERSANAFLAPLFRVASARLRGACSLRSIGQAESTIQVAIGLERRGQLLGLDIRALASVIELLEQTGACMSRLCLKPGDPRLGRYFLSVSRQVAVLGVSPAFLSALEENARGCSVVELRIDARIDLTAPGTSFTTRIAGTASGVRLSEVSDPAGPTTTTPRPRGTLEYTQVAGSSVAGCATSTLVLGRGGRFVVDQVSLTEVTPATTGGDLVRAVRLPVAPEAIPRETARGTGTSPCAPGPIDTEVLVWNSGWIVQHPGGVFAGPDFLPGPPGVFAVASYSGRPVSANGGTLTENTEVRIIHTPEPPVLIPDPTEP